MPVVVIYATYIYLNYTIPEKNTKNKTANNCLKRNMFLVSKPIQLYSTVIIVMTAAMDWNLDWTMEMSVFGW